MSCETTTDNDDVTESSAYQWLRVVKVALGALVSFLTVLQLLGML